MWKKERGREKKFACDEDSIGVKERRKWMKLTIYDGNKVTNLEIDMLSMRIIFKKE